MRGAVTFSRSRKAGVFAIALEVVPPHSIVWGRMYFRKAGLFHRPSIMILVLSDHLELPVPWLRLSEWTLFRVLLA